MSYACEIGANIYRWTLIDFSIGEIVDLVREPENPVDKKTIAIFRHGIRIGHVPKSVSRILAPYLDKGSRYECRIVSVRGTGLHTVISIEINPIKARRIAA